MKGVSVVVCCYNSATRLPNALRYLSRQKFEREFPWEVIVVDNASSDDTSEVAKRAWAGYNTRGSLKIVRESTRGLSAARERGVRESMFDVVVFSDDDNWLAENYIDRAFGLMTQRTDLGAVGGQGQPVFEIKEPFWFKHMRSFYAVGEQKSGIASDMNNFQYLYGAGMVVSRKAMLELYSSNIGMVCSDRVGKSLISGGDIEITIGLQVLGYRVIYSPDLHFEHFIPAQRLTLLYCARLLFGMGYSSDMLFPYRRMFDRTLLLPFPSRKSLRKVLLRAWICGVVLVIPFRRYGSFIDKLKAFIFELGRTKFHILKQNYFSGANQFSKPE